jgi:hypothetical protein
MLGAKKKLVDQERARRRTRTQAILNAKKMVASSLIIQVILSAGALLIFSVSFHDQMPEGEGLTICSCYIVSVLSGRICCGGSKGWMWWGERNKQTRVGRWAAAAM